MTFYYTFTAESDSERILKIDQHLPKLWAIKYRVVFFMKHGVEQYRHYQCLVQVYFDVDTERAAFPYPL